MEFLKNNPKWIRQPKQVQISEDKVVILTERGTDLWARTYYGFKMIMLQYFKLKQRTSTFLLLLKQNSRVPVVLTSVVWLCI